MQDDKLSELQRELARTQEALEGVRRQLAQEIAERKRLQEEFRKRERQLAETQALAHLGSWDWDIRTGVMDWSDELYRILGVMPQAVRPSYQGLLALVHPADRPGLEQALAETLATNRAYAAEFRVCQPGGTERVVCVRGTLLRSPTGEPLRMLGMAQDITERKQAELALQESQERYRRLVEASPDAVFICWEGKFVFINAAGLKLFGASRPQQLLGKPVLAFVHPDYQDLVQQRMADMKQRRQPVSTLEERYLRLDGRAVEVEVTALPFMFEGKCADQVVVHDLTARKQAEAALRETEERYRTLLEHSNDVIWAVDREGRFTFANQRCEEVSGYRFVDFRGRSFAPLAVEEDLPGLWRSFQKALAGTPQTFEARVKRADGSVFLVAGTSAPIWKNGQVEGVVSFGRDITQQRLAEEALRKLSGQLLRVQEEVRRRIARELHDSTAQKLAGMIMSLGLLEDSIIAHPEQARKLVYECLVAAGDCAQEIRSLSHLLHPPLLEELGLEVALDTYVTGFARRSGIQVSLELDSNLTGLSTAAALALFRIVQESLGNVLRHSGSRTAAIQLARVRNRLILEVVDQGHGMTAEVLEQLRQGRPGLGVGIVGMRERLRQLGGTLEIDSTAEGTTVRAIVPLGTPNP